MDLQGKFGGGGGGVKKFLILKVVVIHCIHLSKLIELCCFKMNLGSVFIRYGEIHKGNDCHEGRN